ncbi:trypsin, alkaline B-like [Maniola hyperantus]|uniref:trypsin, alkaline B-like n=1 Tax=Aphantopus hyperantus TaxID=2795564 RepID=UPI003748F4BB
MPAGGGCGSYHVRHAAEEARIEKITNILYEAVNALPCGVSARIRHAFPQQERIIGGSVTNINTYPYSAALLWSRNTISFRQNCGGTIINNRSVLTAAHCIHGNHRVRVGSTNANSGGSVHNGGQRLIHPQYNQGTMNNDIGLLRVTSAFQFRNMVPDNALVWAIGWGWTSAGGNNPSEQLRHVQIRTVPVPRCQSAYPGFRITAGMICAAWDSPGRGSCQGDSGSPLIHNNVIIGATSFGMHCANPQFPTVYARVAHFTNWIRNNA